jgi:hypothetical protein
VAEVATASVSVPVSDNANVAEAAPIQNPDVKAATPSPSPTPQSGVNDGATKAVELTASDTPASSKGSVQAAAVSVSLAAALPDAADSDAPVAAESAAPSAPTDGPHSTRSMDLALALLSLRTREPRDLADGPALAENLRPGMPWFADLADSLGAPVAVQVEGLRGNSSEDAIPTKAPESLEALPGNDIPEALVPDSAIIQALAEELMPEQAGPVGAVFGLDIPALERGMQRFIEDLDQLGAQLTSSCTPTRLPSWLLTLAAAAVALEITRRQWQRAQLLETLAPARLDATFSWYPELSGSLPTDP